MNSAHRSKPSSQRSPLLTPEGSAPACNAWLSAEQAAGRLGVSKATLYAYVSRGLLRAVTDERDPRQKRYAGFDVERLRQRKLRQRRHTEQSLATLSEGWPLLETALSGVWQGQLLYRGVPALGLAESGTLEDAARLLWQCEGSDPFEAAAPAMSSTWRRACAAARDRGTTSEGLLALLALAGPELPSPPSSADLQHSAQAAAAHLRVTIAGLLGCAPSAQALHRQFLSAWRLPARAEGAVRRALVLSADHELNMITFLGRALSSAGAPMAVSLLGAMCSIGASFNGGATEQVEALWDELMASADLEAALAARVARGDKLSGFNHLSYPDGDPRAAAILADCAGFAPLPPIARRVHRLTGWHPALDFALVALRRSLGLPRGAALCLQFGGRTVGILAHILEQRRSHQRLLICGSYVGPVPAPASPGVRRPSGR